MERRNFIKNLVTLASIPLISNKLFANIIDSGSISKQTFELLQSDLDRVLILVRLEGGNDGLNTVIPLDQYSKLVDEKVRKGIAIAESSILKLNGTTTVGFHPSMTALQRIYNENKLAIIQGVANTAGVFSHFHGIDQWESASDKTNTYSSGWIGRYIEKNYSKANTHYPNVCMEDPLAIEIGQLSVVTRGEGTILAQNMSTSFDGNLTTLVENYAESGLSENMKRELAYIRAQQGFTNKYASRISSSFVKGRNSSVVYPASVIPDSFGINAPTTIGQQLKIIAKLIHGGLKTRIFVVSIGNFDNHKSQSQWHSFLLKDLSEAIGAFQKDVENLGIADRIIGMTYSEFGRRVMSNSENGTEHGYAAPMFIFGNMVKGGIIGKNFEIPNVNQINGSSNVPGQYDFRQVYKSVLKGWFGVCDQDALEILKKDFSPVEGIFKEAANILPCKLTPLVNPDAKDCGGIVSVIDVSGDDHHLYARVYPNPNSGSFNIEPSFGFDTSLPIFMTISDIQGRTIMKEEVKVNQGESIKIDRIFKAGIYIISLRNNKYQINQKIVIQ